MERFNLSNRWLTFAERTVALEYESPEVAEVVAFLFHDISSKADIPPHITFHLACHEGRFSLHKGDDLHYKGSDRAMFASVLLTEVGYHLADTCDGGLFFHGAGLSWQNQGILLPGSSGVGKTTLTTWLLARGFDYLSDEFIYIPQNSQKGYGFARPLNLKPTARPVLQHIFNFEQHAAHILSHAEADIVPVHLIESTKPHSDKFNNIPLKLILFPHYQANQTFTAQKLSKAQTSWHLMQTLINARNLPGHGLSEITRLVQTIPAYKISYNDFGNLDEQLIRWLEGS
jgi:hypothetical protein